MIIQLEPGIDAGTRNNIAERVHALGYQSNPVSTQVGEYLVCIGKAEFDMRSIGHLPGVRDIHRVSDDHKLTSLKWKVGRTCIDLGDGGADR